MATLRLPTFFDEGIHRGVIAALSRFEPALKTQSMRGDAKR
jgi:hypothetical protein